MKELKFVWKWCKFCKEYYIECPKCGNNCCNGTFGNKGKCNICPLAYQYQELGWKYKTHPTPTSKMLKEQSPSIFGEEHE